MTKLLEFKHRRSAISEEMVKLANDPTPENRMRYEALTKEADELKGDIERIERAEALAKDLGTRNRPPEDQIGDHGTQDEEAEKRSKAVQEKRELAAMRYWALTGKDPAGLLRQGEAVRDIDLPRELRDMGIGSPTASIPTSVFVPQGFIYDVEIALKSYGALLDNVTTLETATGQPLPYPTSNDTSIEAEIVGEGQQVSTQDVTIGNVILGAWKYSTKLVKVSLELLQDSAFDIQSFLTKAFAIRLARKLTDDFTNGTGTGQPKGIVTAAVLGATAQGSSSNTGGAETGATSIGSKDIQALIHSVDPLYRLKGKFVLHDSTIEALENVLDKYGRPLFIPNAQTGKLETLFGYPLVLDQYMDQLGPHSPAFAAKTILFGDLSKYLRRTVKELQVLRLVERFADFGQVAFIGFSRNDGNLIDAGTNPVKYLQQLSD